MVWWVLSVAQSCTKLRTFRRRVLEHARGSGVLLKIVYGQRPGQGDAEHDSEAADLVLQRNALAHQPEKSQPLPNVEKVENRHFFWCTFWMGCGTASPHGLGVSSTWLTGV
jgi:hypothetical protein